MPSIAIIGAGGFAREVYILARELGYEVSAFLTNKEYIVEPELYGTPVYALEDRESWLIGKYVIAIGNPRLRKKIRESLLLVPNIHFPNLIHPSVPIDSRVKMGHGNIICHGSSISIDINMGNFGLINQACTLGHDTVMEDYVTISPGCNLAGNVHLNDLVEVGTGSILIPKVEIAEGCIVGAGSVVLKSIEDPNVTVFGNPARVMWKNKK